MGKGGGKAKASLVNPNQAIAAYQKGADVIEQQFPIALQQYQQYANQGLRQELDQYYQSQLSGYTYSQTAKDAMNELRGFLGMAPVSKTADMGIKLQSLIDQVGASNLNGSSTDQELRQLLPKVTAAEQLTDPAQRAAAKADIMAQLDKLKVSTQVSLAAFGDAKDGAKTEDGINRNATRQALSDLVGQIGNVASDFSNGYGEEVAKGPTAADIQAKLEATPGYQFQLNQGQKALERTQAARGTLASGNALLEAQQFGQGLAQQTYNQQISQLADLAGMNMPVVQQGINNQMTQAGTVLNQGNAYGAMAQQSIQDIARSREGAFANAGNAQLQAALMNAQLKTQVSMQNAEAANKMFGGIGSLIGTVAGSRMKLI